MYFLSAFIPLTHLICTIPLVNSQDYDLVCHNVDFVSHCYHLVS